MKQKRQAPVHMTDLFFTLSLFCVFCVCAFLVVIIGVNTYEATVIHMDETGSTQTALSYTVEKIRRHDKAGSVSLADMDGETALVLRDVINNETYLTYIYPDSRALYELTVKEGTPVSKDMGEEITEVSGFSVSSRGNGLFEFSASQNTGADIHFFLHLRSETIAD